MSYRKTFTLQQVCQTQNLTNQQLRTQRRQQHLQQKRIEQERQEASTKPLAFPDSTYTQSFSSSARM